MTTENNASIRSKLYALTNPNVVIKYLIYHQEAGARGEFLVYLDEELDLEWECDDTASAFIDTAPLKEQVHKIVNEVGALEPIPHNWPSDLKLSSKRLLGEAVAIILRGDTPGAERALAHATKFIKTKSKQVSRFWTLQSCLFAGAVAALLAMLSVFFRTALIRWFGEMPFLLGLCFFVGCVGALLFVIMRLGKQPKVDSTAERHLHYIEGVARIAAGGIAGILVGGMVKLGLILPVFTQAGMQSLSMCIAAMIAGASERMAAGIITKVENNQPTDEEAAHGND